MAHFLLKTPEHKAPSTKKNPTKYQKALGKQSTLTFTLQDLLEDFFFWEIAIIPHNLVIYLTFYVSVRLKMLRLF